MARTSRFKSGIVPVMGGAELFKGKPSLAYTFDGSTMYATIPPYAAVGKPRNYTFNFRADAVATGTEQYIASGTEGGIDFSILLHATLPQIVIHYRNSAGTQAVETVTLPEIVAGENSKLEVVTLGPGSEVYVNGVQADITAFDVADGLQPPLTHLGVKHDLTGYFAGELWGDYFIDESPITDTDACMGNGIRYVTLAESIVLEGDFEIELDCIRQDATGVGTWVAAGDSSAATAIRLYDTGNASPDEVRVQGGGGLSQFINALKNVALGQHFGLRLVRSGTDLSLYIDGVVDPVTRTHAGDFTFSSIASDGVSDMPTDSALQNVRITDITEDREWLYTLDEGAGVLAADTGASGLANNGTWTPNTDWQYIASDSRNYPINEGPASGGTLTDTISGQDGTIVNYNEANWGGR